VFEVDNDQVLGRGGIVHVKRECVHDVAVGKCVKEKEKPGIVGMAEVSVTLVMLAQFAMQPRREEPQSPASRQAAVSDQPRDFWRNDGPAHGSLLHKWTTVFEPANDLRNWFAFAARKRRPCSRNSLSVHSFSRTVQ
jgi:hypothetical protein